MERSAAGFISRLLAEFNLSSDQLLIAILINGVIFSCVHLMTMMLTRWGDSKTSSKAFLFSLLVHFSCAIGVVTVQPDLPPVLADQAPEERMQIRELVVEGSDQVEQDQFGNTPIWEQMSAPPEAELARIDRTLPEAAPLEAPQRLPEEPLHQDVNVPDRPTIPEEPVAAPELKQQAPEGLMSESVAPLLVEDVTAESRPEVSIPSTAKERQPLPRSGLLEVPQESRARAGAVDRILPEVNIERQMAAITVPENVASVIKQDGGDNLMQNRTGPAPTISPDPQAGLDPSSDAAGTVNEAPVSPRFTRTLTRQPMSLPSGSDSRFQPQRTASTPEPAPAPVIASREGISPVMPFERQVNPNIVRPNIEALRTEDRVSLPATYRLRNRVRREAVARKFGGTKDSERAVEASLQWLATNQHPDGYWDADAYGSGRVKFDESGVDRQRAGIDSDTGVTALAILAFLGAGYTHEEGRYAPNIDRALMWLISQQRADGFLGASATHFAQMYCHGMSSYALAEAYGMQQDPELDPRLRQPLERAINYIVQTQNQADGGWRYVPGQKSDMSMFGWQLMALKSAEIAGIAIPDDVKSRMILFLKERSLGDRKGLAAYRMVEPPELPTPSMTAEALFCKQMLGIRRTNPSSQEAVEFLLIHLPRRSEHNLYYWYYGTLAMYQFGGEPWKQWNESLRDLLIAEQIVEGKDAGSWDPLPPWGPYGGRIYSTALSTLCLEVYYRFLPLYQMGGLYTDE